MACTALLIGVPPLTPASLTDFERELRNCDLNSQVIPFGDRFRPNNLLTVGVAMRRGPGMNVFFWDPSFWTLLNFRQTTTELYEVLLKGCIDFIAWPCCEDELAARLRRVKALNDEHSAPNGQPVSADIIRDLGLVGCSDCFLSALRLTEKFARYEVPVLLEGESGTGKELFARALHYLGPRRGQPFVPINCAALPDTLIENELFGHVSGAYTGAHGPMDGVIAQANGGTLLFDEVHCLSPKGQATLLRFTQDLHYRPLGASTRPRRANVRLVAATNQCLWDCVCDGRFREDLYYRLNVGFVRLPPLRERKQDIVALVNDIITKLCTRYGTAPRRFDAPSLAWLSAQPWKGNVRELDNVIHRAFMLSDDPVIRIDPHCACVSSESQATEMNQEALFKEARQRALREFEADYLRRMLIVAAGNVTEAARRAGKDRRVFGRLMKKHGIERGNFVPD
jgi:two-component system response regulator GlrR